MGSVAKCLRARCSDYYFDIDCLVFDGQLQLVLLALADRSCSIKHLELCKRSNTYFYLNGLNKPSCRGLPPHSNACQEARLTLLVGSISKKNTSLNKTGMGDDR